MKRLLPSGPLTEQPIPANGRDEVVVGSPGRNSALDMMPSEDRCHDLKFLRDAILLF